MTQQTFDKNSEKICPLCPIMILSVQLHFSGCSDPRFQLTYLRVIIWSLRRLTPPPGVIMRCQVAERQEVEASSSPLLSRDSKASLLSLAGEGTEGAGGPGTQSIPCSLTLPGGRFSTLVPGFLSTKLVSQTQQVSSWNTQVVGNEFTGYILIFSQDA